jgi:hypothetical protein
VFFDYTVEQTISITAMKTNAKPGADALLVKTVRTSSRALKSTQELI